MNTGKKIIQYKNSTPIFHTEHFEKLASSHKNRLKCIKMHLMQIRFAFDFAETVWVLSIIGKRIERNNVECVIKNSVIIVFCNLTQTSMKR